MTLPRSSRNPWPIAITVFFFVFFLGLVGFIVFATTHQADLVRADYYEEELRFQQQLDRVNHTQRLGQAVSVAYDIGQRCIAIQLPPAQAEDIAGRIHLYRPSDARLDRELPLDLRPDGTQRVDASQLPSGLWKVRLEWSNQGRDYYFDQPVVIRPPA
jgi:hypothetical protein